MTTIIEIDRNDYTIYKNRKLIKKINNDLANELWDLARDLSDPIAKNAVWIKKGSSIHSEFYLSDNAINEFIAKIELI